MKHVISLLVIALFLAGMSIVPVGVDTTSTHLQETMHNELTLEHESEMSWVPPDRTVRVALYNETNSTSPSYVTFGHLISMNTNYTMIHDVLVGAGYDVTRLTTQDILDHKLRTVDYDVLVLADNVPRESIFNYTLEFWRGGGSILSFDSGASFLGYGGILPREGYGTDDGLSTYFNYNTEDKGNVSARHPVMKSHELNEQLSYNNDNYVMYDWTALMGTTIASDLVKLTFDEDDTTQVQAIAMDPTDMGGKVVQIGIPIDPWASSWENVIIDAIDWLYPRPKGYILYDLSHNPNFSTDSWDTTSGYPTYYSDFRNLLVNHSFCIDKLYPDPSGNLTSSRISDYDMLVVVMPRINFTNTEVSDVTTFVEQGGSLLAIGDKASGDPHTATRINYLVSEFDVRLYTTILNSLNVIGNPTNHPIAEGVSSLEFGEPNAYVNITGSAESVFNNGPDIWVGADEVLLGRIVLSGDSNIFDVNFFNDAEQQRFALNVANWLTATDSKVLAFVDTHSSAPGVNENAFKGPVAQALNELGVSWYLTDDDEYFNRSLYRYDWDLVVIDQLGTNLNNYWGDLLHYVKSGERLIYSSYQWNQLVGDAKPFRDYVGFSYYNTPYPQPPVYFWPDSDKILNIPNQYTANNVTTTGTWTFYTCKNLTVFSNATAFAGYSVSQPDNGTNATIVLGAGGNVLANGALLSIFENDTDDSTYADNFELWENEISFMLRPSVDRPSDITIEVGSRGESVTWNPYSSKPASYRIVRNSFEIANMPWDGSPVVLNLEEDNLGTETFYLTVYDIFGQSITDEVDVRKEDTTAPIIVDASDLLHYEEGTVSYWVNWTFTEMFPDSYVLYVNESYEASVDWDGSEISIDVGGFIAGVYNLTLAVNDTSGNLATSTLYLLVTTTTINPPDLWDYRILIIAAVVVIIVAVIVKKKPKK
jgi:hypothetical protein